MAGRLVPLVLLGATAVGVQTWLLPILTHLGVTRSVTSVNNDAGTCRAIAGLEACEDHWIHRQSGISYLPCSTIGARAHWTPALDLFSLEGIKGYPSDQIKMYDINTGSVSTIKIENTPPHLLNMHLHAIDAWVDPSDSEKLTFFINNHGVPASGEKPHTVGADSTIEVFESRLGSKTWRHVKTIRDEKILTPNNIVATGSDGFYVSNDHFHKTSGMRILSLLRLPGGTSSIVHCKFSRDGGASPATCIDAAEGFQYPNGIARGPDSSIYVATSALGDIKQMHIQADYSLIEGDTLAEKKGTIDNIHVTEKGEIIVATIPKVLQFVDRAKKSAGPCPVEVWRVKNETSDDKFYGKRYTSDLIFADAEGNVAPGTTNAQLYRGKVYLTGLTTPNLVVCYHPAFKA